MSHYEQRLERDLTEIRERVAALSEKVENAIKDAIHAVLTGNRQLAYATVLRDSRINRSTREIDRLCHSFIVRHLPSAGHLREMSATIRAVIQLERIGDYAVIISREGVQLSRPPEGAAGREVDLVSSHALRMLRQALAAFRESNESAARSTMEMGEQLEGKLDAIYGDLMDASEPGQVSDLMAMFVIFSQVKRVIDQAKNICEETVFAATGEIRGERIHDVLFLDRDDSALGQMAVAIGRKTYGEIARYHSAGQSPAEALDPAMTAFMDSHGYDTSEMQPSAADLGHDGLAEYFVVVSLQGPISSYCESVPFHTSVLEWDIGELPHGGDEAEREGRYAEIYRELAVQVRDLAETLSGGDS